MEKGLIIKNTGSWYDVLYQDKTYTCKIKGNFKVKGIKATNPLTVGDYVDFELNSDNTTGLINKIHDRKNYIIRKSINLSKQYHIIAANIDQALLMITIMEPETTTIFIDRFLVSANIYQIPVILVFNKIDLLDSNQQEYLKAITYLYSSIGYQCVETSVIKDININAISKIIENKTTLISGHSGVGKSALIKKIDPDIDIKIGDISSYHKMGKHTTSYSRLYVLKTGGAIIDTPGIKGFGIVDMNVEDISHNFPEMFKLLGQCQYYNCKHTHEPGCAVKQAVDDGRISQSRYESYLSLLNNDERNNKYRK